MVKGKQRSRGTPWESNKGGKLLHVKAPYAKPHHGMTSPKFYANIRRNDSYSYMESLDTMLEIYLKGSNMSPNIEAKGMLAILMIEEK